MYLYSDNEIGNEGLMALSQNISNIRQLRKLNISFNKIEESGLISLCDNLSFVTRLRLLDFSSNNIGRLGAETFNKSLHFLPNLILINYTNNNIKDECIASFCLNCSNLSELDSLFLCSMNILKIYIKINR